MPAHGTLAVYVQADDTMLPEYDIAVAEDTPDGIPVVSCWVPSESGKSFSFKCRDTRRPRAAESWSFSVDGAHVGRRVLRADHGPFADRKHNSCSFSRALVNGVFRELEFAPLALTDDDDALARGPHAQLGEIHVDVLPVRVKGTSRRVGESVALHAGAVHAGLLRALVHRARVHSVRVGPVSQRRHRNAWSTAAAGPPLAKFVFKYRPLPLLQAQGIAPPPTPAPSPPPARRPSSSEIEFKDEDTEGEDDDIRRLQEQIASLRRKRGGAPKVKAEPAPSRPRPSAGTDEVIDLTSD